MKANALIMESPESLATTEIDVPEIGPNEVLMRVELSASVGRMSTCSRAVSISTFR